MNNVKISEIDKSNMHQMILDFPKQFRVGAEAAKNAKVTGKFDKVLICGIGGSALPGDVLSMWLKAYKIELPLYIHRDYGLPYKVDKKSLVVFISYSGNTEETIYAYQAALREKLSMIVITTGGKLGELCKKNKTPWVKIPLTNLPPRLALGCQFAALIQVLVNCGVIRDNLEDILTLEKSLKSIDLEVQGRTLAKKLKNKIPLIYVSNKAGAIGPISLMWKVSFNETAKIMAISNYFPEVAHNEIVGFWKINEMQLKGNKLYVIILRDKDEHPRILKQIKIVKDIIEKEDVEVEIIDMKGRNILEKIFSTIILGFWTAYWLALKYKIDPTPTKMIEEFKRRLK